MIWLNPDQVAERLGISRRSALEMMASMPHTIISGSVRPRRRVSEEALDKWMVKHSAGVGRPSVTEIKTGSKKKLQRK